MWVNRDNYFGLFAANKNALALKKGVFEFVSATTIQPKLKRANLRCLRAFWPFFNFELHILAFVQAAIAATFDCRKMSEYVSAAFVWSNETEAFIGVEPLNFALLSHDA